MAHRATVKNDLATTILGYILPDHRATRGATYIDGRPHTSFSAKEIFTMLESKGIEFTKQEVGDALTVLIRKGKVQIHIYPNPNCVGFVLSDSQH